MIFIVLTIVSSGLKPPMLIGGFCGKFLNSVLLSSSSYAVSTAETAVRSAQNALRTNG